MQLLSRFLQSAAIHSFVTKFSRTKNLTIKGTITGIQKSALYPRFNKTPLLIGCRLSCVLHFSKRSTFSLSAQNRKGTEGQLGSEPLIFLSSRMSPRACWPPSSWPVNSSQLNSKQYGENSGRGV